MGFRTLDDIGEMSGKAVLVREDLNVPMQNGMVSDDLRIRSAIPTIAELSDRGAKVLVLAHFGRPKGVPNPEFSLAPLVAPLAAALGRPVRFIADCQGDEAAAAVAAMAPGEIALLENTRFVYTFK